MKSKRSIPSVSVLYTKISKNNLLKSAISTDELWYSRILGRKISIYFTWLLLNLGATPNQSTLLSFICGVIGLYFLTSIHFPAFLFGFIFFHLYIIIDSSDGEMARFLNMKSEMGAFYDKLLHYLMKIGIIVTTSIQVYNRVGLLEILILGLLIGLLSGFTSTFYHLLPRNNTVSYSEQVLQDGTAVALVRKVFRLITGDIELSIFLLICVVFERITHISALYPLSFLLFSQVVLLSTYIVEQLYSSAMRA